ncbi:MFS transporter [Nocardia alni]|uniref:MFS transporter n=1 Tax=Nocardia alni TaxID=2815723 RepID=UPI001C24AEDD|nr:MFS transporter [Nocardia alni]
MTDIEIEQRHRGDNRWRVLGALGLALFLVALDSTVVSMSLPVIIADVGLSLTQAQWVSAVYAVVFAALLITAGWFGDRLGRRALIMTGVVLIMAGSLIAAAANEPSVLIWGRIVQGIGGAGVLPGALATAGVVFSGRERRLVYTAWAAVICAAAVLGPLLGGWLSTSFTWPWIFLVNLPIGVVVLIGIAVFVPETRSGQPAHGSDVDGFLLGTAGFALVMFALIEGQAYGWWRPLRAWRGLGIHWSSRAGASPIPLLLVLGIILLALFLLWEQHRRQVDRAALLDFSLLGRPSVRWGSAAALAVAVVVFGLLFTLPLYLVYVRGLTALRGGLVLMAISLGAGAATIVTLRAGWPAGPVWSVRLGLAIQTLSIAVTAIFLTDRTPMAWLVVLLVCYGIGLGLASAQLPRAILAGMPADTSERVSMTPSTVHKIGAALGVAILGGVLSISLGQALSDRLTQVHGLSPVAAHEAVAATRDSAGAAIPVLRAHHASHLVTDALARGFADAFRATLIAAVVLLLLGFCAATRIPLRATRIPQEPASADPAAESAPDKPEGDAAVNSLDDSE